MISALWLRALRESDCTILQHNVLCPGLRDIVFGFPVLAPPSLTYL